MLCRGMKKLTNLKEKLVMSDHSKWSTILCYRKSPLRKNKINFFKPKILMSNKIMLTGFKKSESHHLTSKKNLIKWQSNSKINKKMWMKFNNKFKLCFPNLKIYSNNNNRQKSKILNLVKKLRLPLKIYLNYCLKNNNFLFKKLHFLNKRNSPL